MKKKAAPPESLPARILLHVLSYGANVLACLRDEPITNPQSKKAIGIVNLNGTSQPPGWAFRVSVYPNGTKLPKPFLRTDSLIPVAEMSVHQSQMAAILAVLNDADTAHAVFELNPEGSDPPFYVDVHGEFKKRPKT